MHLQGELLSSIQNTAHASSMGQNGIVVSPFCQQLTCEDALQLFAQVSTMSQTSMQYL